MNWKTNGTSLHPRPSAISRAMAAFSSLLLQRGWEKSRSAHTALDAEEGGREGGKEVGREDWGGRKGGKGGKCERDFFFFTFDKSCSHMGGTRPCDLTKRLNREWSQWSIHQQTRSAWRRWRRGKIKMKRTSVCRTVKELIQAVSTECGAFLLWCVWVSTSAALLFYSVRCKRHKNIISSCY